MASTARPLPNEPPDDEYQGHAGLSAARRNGARTRVPPHDLNAEASLLGACLLSPTRTYPDAVPVISRAIAAALNAGIAETSFYRPAHGHIWSALVELHDAGAAVDVTTVADVLHRDGLLESIGGPAALVALQTGTPSIGAADTYARIVADFAETRRLIAVAAEIADLGYSQPDDIGQAVDRAAQLVADINPRRAVVTAMRDRAVNGAAFLLDQPDTITAVWGSGDVVLWAEGEATMIVGPTGIGKTTLCQQVVLGRIGIRTEVLGQPVTPGNSRVLYLACDRPRQAARSMRRMVDEQDRFLLEDLLVFWKGPLPFDIVADPLALARFAREHAADTVVIDSLKDVCHKLNDDEHASKTNAAIQECIASGVEVMDLHHQRKKSAGDKTAEAPKSLDEVYGNTWLTAGQGSVISISGQAGDPLVELSHLKPPAEQAGPWTLRMDFDLGYTTIDEEVSPLSIVLTAPRGVTVELVAQLVFKTEAPTANQREKARYRLKKLVDQGRVVARETPSPTGGKPTVLYFGAERNRTP